MIESVRHRWEFSRIRECGTYRRSGPLSVRAASDDELHSPRFAFAIGTGVGNAVERNRIRRRLREILRTLVLHEQVKPGRYLIIVSPQATTSSFDDLRVHLSRLVGNE